MKVVVNAGPLIALGKLGLIDVLPRLYDTILIPAAVYDEVVTRGSEQGTPDALAVRMAVSRHGLQVIHDQRIELSEAVAGLALDPGEKQVIQVALDQAADLALLDDLLARERAAGLGLTVKGTVGVLVDAYRQGLITMQELELTFATIAAREDIWIGDTLLQRVLAALREG